VKKVRASQENRRVLNVHDLLRMGSQPGSQRVPAQQMQIVIMVAFADYPQMFPKPDGEWS
jgi:hypothetical protein